MSSFPFLSLPLVRWTFSVIFAAPLLALAGCSTKPQPIALTIRIEPAGQAASLSIPVHVGGANRFYNKSLMEDPPDQILEKFRISDPSDIESFQLTADGKTISKNDAIWNVWLNQNHATELVVIGDLPKNFGGEGQRRVIIPLDKELWRNLSSKKEIHVEVRETGLKLLDTPGK